MKYHTTWYLKIPLTDDLSVRYFFAFDDMPKFKNKWVIKSHKTKEYAVLNENAVKLILESHNKTLDDAVEIIARQEGEYYRKIELNEKNELLSEEDLKTHPPIRISFETDFCKQKQIILKDYNLIDGIFITDITDDIDDIDDLKYQANKFLEKRFKKVN